MNVAALQQNHWAKLAELRAEFAAGAASGGAGVNGGLVFALAGRVVTTTKEARSIWIDAIKTKKRWIEPQARSVMRRLRAAGQ